MSQQQVQVGPRMVGASQQRNTRGISKTSTPLRPPPWTEHPQPLRMPWYPPS